MKNKEFQRRLTYDTLVLLGVFTLILFLCRIWPLILLCILGIFVAMIRLLFLSRKEVAMIQAVPEPQPKPRTEGDLQRLALELAIRRITTLVSEAYPQARWVWKSAHAKEDIQSGRDVVILLNRAGGYREAVVHIQNLQVSGITYRTGAETETKGAEAEPQDQESKSATKDAKTSSEQPVNYELLAFEWVDAHVLELNTRCNEGIANGEEELLLAAAELPERPSWSNVCEELKRNGIHKCEPTSEGIIIHITQKNCRKE